MNNRLGQPPSFDTRGFTSSLSFLALITLAFATVHFGTTYALERIDVVSEQDLLYLDVKIAEVKAQRKLRTVGERHLLARLKEYEDTLSTRTIGTASIETLATAHETMIGADLAAMKLYLFEKGVAVAEYDILSKGKRGSRWETPTGLYKIETKEESHFSSIGEVYMPQSMQFFGNFFIHGWPYYPDGTPVSPGYSGGCIRLATADAEKVFDFAKRGTPIFVWEEGATASSTIEITSPPPRVRAHAFLVADIGSGTVFAEQNATTTLPIASLSKLVTALVANETIHYDRPLTISKEDRAATDGTPGNLPSGETFSVAELISALLMESNNTSAYTLARSFGTGLFTKWMHDKARAIGMEHTSFEDPSGISASNTSSANDLFKLARYIHNSQSFILNVTREKEKTIAADSGKKYPLANFNHFANDPRFLGGKTGVTPEAKETMLALFEIPTSGATTTLAIIVLGSQDRERDVKTLLEWFEKSATITITE